MGVNGFENNDSKKMIKKKSNNHLPVIKVSVLLAWRIARVVEWTGLENQRTARYRGFESLILRQSLKRVSQSVRLFFVCSKINSFGVVWDQDQKLGTRHKFVLI